MGFLFCIYISASLFAMMNLLTGVFVDKAMRSVREDKDMVLAKRIRDLFLTDDMEGPCEINWEDFSAKLRTNAMQEYFKQINVEVAEARSLFDLLDEDSSGSIDSKEIVEGCLKLRGPARALELSLLARDIVDLQVSIKEIVIDLRVLLIEVIEREGQMT